MSDLQYHSDIYISWDALQRHSRRLAASLLHKDDWKGIIAIARGGMIPAAIIARELNIRQVDTICVASYEGQSQSDSVTLLNALHIDHDGEGYLLIDDLVDTGRTAKFVRELLPKAYFATLYAKPEGRERVDECIKEVPQDTWIRFPWDTDLSFVPPLSERISKP